MLLKNIFLRIYLFNNNILFNYFHYLKTKLYSRYKLWLWYIVCFFKKISILIISKSSNSNLSRLIIWENLIIIIIIVHTFLNVSRRGFTLSEVILLQRLNKYCDTFDNGMVNIYGNYLLYLFFMAKLINLHLLIKLKSLKYIIAEAILNCREKELSPGSLPSIKM